MHDPENEGTMVICKVSNCLPVGTVFLLRRLESSSNLFDFYMKFFSSKCVAALVFQNGVPGKLHLQ
jgi:hypothetical protein